MNKKIITLILIISLVAIGLVCLHVDDNNKPKETESILYDTDEELTSVEIAYLGRPVWSDVLTIDFAKNINIF